MGRSIWLIVLLLSLGACAGAANAPALDSPATITPPAKDETLSSCETLDDAPTAMLSYGEQRQDDARIAINWQSQDWVINGHPIDTLPLPQVAIRVRQRGSPQLTFSAEPDAVSGYAWRPDFDAVQGSSSNRLEVPLDARRGTTRIDLAFEPVASQLLDLHALPPGRYAIELFAGWHRGSSGFAFHVEIIEP